MNEPSVSPNENAPVRGSKYLTFTLREESYGVPVQGVREIIPLTLVTPVPRLPEYIEGVINLRGKIIPVLNMGLRFGFPPSATSERVCIIVVQLKTESAAVAQCGLIVDAVEEVISIAPSEIEATPDFASNIDTGCIAGLVNLNGKVKTLLHIEKIVSPDQRASLQSQLE